MANEIEEKKTSGPSGSYTAPKGSEADFQVDMPDGPLKYRAEAKWIVLRKNEKPKAEMFYTGYFLIEKKNPPVTFVFNGGPGASSVYLHLGAMGPKRVDLDERGLPDAPPHKLVDNQESWLTFTDLVFVDPIGTGLSRMIEEDKPKDDKSGGKAFGEEKKPVSEYWRFKRDLESICEFVLTWLSTHHRWESPVFIAGESYGGYRVGKLVKLLQKDYGVGLAGAVIISPALDFSLLDHTAYNVLPWVDVVPSMAAGCTSSW